MKDSCNQFRVSVQTPSESVGKCEKEAVIDGLEGLVNLRFLKEAVKT